MARLPDSFTPPPEPEPSAWDYACAAQSRYFYAAFGIMFLPTWIAIGMHMGTDFSFWLSFFVTLFIFMLGTLTLALPILLLILASTLAWLAGLCLRVEDRRRLIAEHRTRDEREWRATLANPPPRKSRNDGWLTGLLLGALLGFWWGYDDD